MEPTAWTMGAGSTAAVLAVTYLVGSIPFGLILTQMAGLGDIRSIGSGNIGATNVLRTGNKALAAATLLLDAGKGAAGVLIGAQFAPEGALIGAVAATFGHMFPVWLGFRGGKGVATGFGALAMLAWPSAVIAAAIWLLSALTIRISSASALLTTALAPIHVWYFTGPWTALSVAGVCALIWIRHHQNIARLLRGEEPKIGQKKKG
jgi:glycerol-3-phosphate acyltransferase PlsY